MTVSIQQFKVNFPEFERAPDTLVQGRLDMAVRRINRAVFNTTADDATYMLTAHLLTISPSGEQARLKMKDRGDFYEKELRRMKLEATAGVGRVA